MSSLSGCSSQADTSYPGEPLFTISGAVESPPAELNASTVPVLCWTEDASVFQTVEVSGEFPNRFTLRVYDPPPTAAVIRNPDGARVAVARICALRAGADWNAQDMENGPVDWFLGGVGNYLVAWLERPLTDTGVRAEDGQPAQLAAGYNLLRLDEWTEAEQADRARCFDEAHQTALDAMNARHGTSYDDISLDVPEEIRRTYYDAHDERHCGADAKMTLVSAGLSQPLTMRFGKDVHWVQWQ